MYELSSLSLPFSLHQNLDFTFVFLYYFFTLFDYHFSCLLFFDQLMIIIYVFLPETTTTTFPDAQTCCHNAFWREFIKEN